MMRLSSACVYGRKLTRLVRVRVRVRARARVGVSSNPIPNPNPDPDPNQLYFDFMLKSRLFNVRLGLVITALVMFLVTMPDVAALGPDSNGLLAQVLQPWPLSPWPGPGP